MFGHHDDDQNDDQAASQFGSAITNHSDKPFLHPNDQAGTNDASADTPAADEPTEPQAESQKPADQPVSMPWDAPNSDSSTTDDLDPSEVTGDDSPADVAVSSGSSGSNDLLGIKQEALQQLTPLVDHLDQTPEERFQTIMMMIQTSDNQLLIKDAYEAAQQITDEKSKAQALLDVVNEINYFTQHSSSNSSS